MKKTFLVTIFAALIGLFSTQAMACSACKNGGQCSCQHQGDGKSCGCKGGSCKGE